MHFLIKPKLLKRTLCGKYAQCFSTHTSKKEKREPYQRFSSLTQEHQPSYILSDVLLPKENYAQKPGKLEETDAL